ncbi:hypothetical protein HK097_006706 [Rhizophlyctis rosea]|uniref:Radical SAM core domain-containing protein n=1 Tax=Rhizophlyctis rosea TaxID=64517 RepID=A0AAD5X211_9FUNG|nr:hypothetical protein HK097_006706 [Rhizophlyctis rosea]
MLGLVSVLVLLVYKTKARKAQYLPTVKSPSVINSENNTPPIPVSVNYHFTRKCNFACGFCFHTAKTIFMLPMDEAKRGLQLLKDAGTLKVNFAGGEPFLHKEYLGELLDYCKTDLGFESVSIVSNGSMITRPFLLKHGTNIDILAVSCDSFNPETNQKIGRLSGNPLPKLKKIAAWCKEFGIKFKINTVVNRYNVNEDMNHQITTLAPFRWKCFQVLLDESENAGSTEQSRDVHPFLISRTEYDAFIARHQQQPSLVPEPNDLMRSSYLILDEYMRFLSKEGEYKVSPSILDVSVEAALDGMVWRREEFVERGGIYEWSREVVDGRKSEKLDW